MIPDFYGEYQLLSRFLVWCEKLIVRFYDSLDPNVFLNEYLMSTVLSKIKEKEQQLTLLILRIKIISLK